MHAYPFVVTGKDSLQLLGCANASQKEKISLKRSVSCSFFSFPPSSLILFFVVSQHFSPFLLSDLLMFSLYSKLIKFPFSLIYSHRQTSFLKNIPTFSFFATWLCNCSYYCIFWHSLQALSLCSYICFFCFRMTNNTVRNKQYNFYISDISQIMNVFKYNKLHLQSVSSFPLFKC